MILLGSHLKLGGELPGAVGLEKVADLVVRYQVLHIARRRVKR